MKTHTIFFLISLFIFCIGCKTTDTSPTESNPPTFNCGTSMVEYAEKTYHTVQIGNQCWLKENLDVGTRISRIDTAKNNGIIEKYCYNDSEANCTTYGGLYQWAEAVQYKNGATNRTSPSPAFSGNVQGICPSSWHIPTYAEQQTLATAVSNNSNALKVIGQGTGNGAGTNSSGFSALLAGYYSNTYYFILESYASFWSSTENSTTNPYDMNLGSKDSVIYFSYRYYKEYGFSVRCVHD